MKKETLICLLAFLLWACNDENAVVPDYNGTDNYIVTFDITQEGITWNAKITDQQIILTLPYGHHLTGASAKVVLTENAVISPDPAEITNWNEDKSFTVTAYNGEERIYKYTVEYAEKTPSGDVLLLNQEEVNKFAGSGISVIQGNLIIGSNTKENQIQNLEGLNNLELITGMLQINSSYIGNDLKGLENLHALGSLKIGDIVTVSDIPALTDITLPALQEVTGGNIYLSLHTLEKLSFQKLQSIAGSVYINSTQIEEFNLPHLQKVAGEITLSGGGLLETLSLPELQSLGGNLAISGLTKLVTCDFPVLNSVKNLTVENCTLLQNIIFEQLPTCGSLVLRQMTSLENLRFSSLQTINGDFELTSTGTTNTVFTDFSALNNLQVINGQFTFQGFRGITGIDKLEKLRSVKGFTFQNLSGWTDELNLTNIDLNGGTLACTNIYIPVIKGPEVFNGSISFTRSSATKLSVLEGFKTFNGSLTLTNYNTGGFVLSINQVEYIENLTLTACSYITSIEAPGLKEIAGTLSINNGRMLVDFPALQRIGKQISITGTVTNIQGFNFPQLKEIGDGTLTGANCVEITLGKFNIAFPLLEQIKGSANFTTGTAANTLINSLQYPVLTTIKGNLTISATHANSALSKLNFDKLTTIEGSITINNLAALTDFSTFSTVIPVLDSNRWIITNCGYNPTWQQMNLGQTTN